MGCPSCPERRAAKPQEPYEVLLPDGTKKVVANKAEERVARDQAYVRARAKARADGYRLSR